jgi:hypothetical protein
VNQKRNEVAGYDVFLGVEDKELQARNRAQVLNNIFEDGANENNKIGTGTAQLMTDYVKLIPKEERAVVVQALAAMRGRK